MLITLNMVKRILGIIAACYFLASCKPLNPSIMFKTPKDYQYDAMVKDTLEEYRISPNDIINLRLFANNGLELVDLTKENNQELLRLTQGIEYLVEHDGQVNLPLIGRVQVNGKTLRELEFFLEEQYEKVYIDPFMLLSIINRRVIVFTGNGGDGSVITLQNNNVKLLEAIALAGGLTQQGRAARIKLIRGELSNPEVYLIDLSTIDGIQQADIILQANDIIYVEPIGVTTRQVLSEVAPILGLATSLITLYFVINNLN